MEALPMALVYNSQGAHAQITSTDMVRGGLREFAQVRGSSLNGGP